MSRGPHPEDMRECSGSLIGEYHGCSDDIRVRDKWLTKCSDSFRPAALEDPSGPSKNACIRVFWIMLGDIQDHPATYVTSGPTGVHINLRCGAQTRVCQVPLCEDGTYRME